MPLNNINLSEIIWIKVFKRSMPNFWLFREIFGLALVRLLRRRAAAAALEDAAAAASSRRWTRRATCIGVSLGLMMMSLPIKMYLRWIFNLKYIVSIPEFAFNI